VNEEAFKLTTDDTTDSKFQIEDRKRRLAQEIDNVTKDKRLNEAKVKYSELKERCFKLIDSNGNDYEIKIYNDIVIQEASFLSSNSAIRIHEKSDELNSIISTILWRTPDFLVSVFNNLQQKLVRMNDPTQARALTEAGQSAIDSQSWNRLSEINSGLINLLPKSVQAEITTKVGF
jgi:molecular chaperone DnaK